MSLSSFAGLRILSIDHGPHDLVPVAVALGADPARIPVFKCLAVMACVRAAAGRPGFGMFLDGALGAVALAEATALGLWVARQFPQDDPQAIAREPSTWPGNHVVKLIANSRPDARTRLADHLTGITRVMEICRTTGHRTLIEVLVAEGTTTAALIARLCEHGLRPDYWLIEAQATRADWQALETVLAQEKQSCQGFIVIARSAQSHAEIKAAAAMPGVIGFVGGRAIFAEVFKDWLKGVLTDDAAIQALADRLSGFAAAFDAGRHP